MSNPDAQQFHEAAMEFWQAADRLALDGKPFLFKPTFYCAIHSLELGLKALLAKGGTTSAELASRKLGHNLDALISKAYADGVLSDQALDSLQRSSICQLCRDYSRKSFEYPEPMYSTFPIGQWLKWAERVNRAF
jgi:hypothetical protein